jgi:hypothetical protein
VTKIPSTHSPRAAALLLALAAATCFTGDGLIGQPCDDDPDCNPLADVVGEALVCRYKVCGYAPRCGDAIVDADVETCDDGAANLAADYADGPRPLLRERVHAPPLLRRRQHRRPPRAVRRRQRDQHRRMPHDLPRGGLRRRLRRPWRGL